MINAPVNDTIVISNTKQAMLLEIITPDKRIYSGQVKLVQLPGTKGSFEILKNHAPIISTLEKGKIKVIEESGEILYFEVEGGVIENKDNKIIVLVESV
jgi:F-type H+-transporting ATPase subunit epsilon